MSINKSEHNNHKILDWARNLQKNLISIQNEVENHKHAQKKWDVNIYPECDWIEKNFDIVLGSPLATTLQCINDINLEGGPSQGNLELISEAIISITKFIGWLIAQDKKKVA